MKSLADVTDFVFLLTVNFVIEAPQGAVFDLPVSANGLLILISCTFRSVTPPRPLSKAPIPSGIPRIIVLPIVSPTVAMTLISTAELLDWT